MLKRNIVVQCAFGQDVGRGHLAWLFVTALGVSTKLLYVSTGMGDRLRASIPSRYVECSCSHPEAD